VVLFPEKKVNEQRESHQTFDSRTECFESLSQAFGDGIEQPASARGGTNTNQLGTAHVKRGDRVLIINTVTHPADWIKSWDDGAIKKEDTPP